MDETEYRIEFAVQRKLPGDADFTEIGFGSSGAWGSLRMCSHMLASGVDNYEWETEAGQPDPATIKAADEARLDA
jgi:hypothetical protein